MIRYLYYDPTLSQKIAIWKAKFFATGWIWVATAISTYIALNGLHYANRHFEKGRYNI
ncbi:putative integral membrane protein [Babesia bovis T2Bo]|uniref:putative integral membrane protein n=1 Tax=Babesia bovis T2Bo TaxID=484906 RepID=UPI001E1599B0|nr:putative integral membrane protein [Babesia bovis T2Bo]KAG6439939.1 putative integral membrane protein [Babesia bovis T2Bo]